jgi:hypothetical protein
MHGYKDVDPSDVDVSALLSRIAKEHVAEIKAEEVDSAVTVTVKATNRAKAQEIIAILRDQLRYRPGEENVWRARLLVHPPSDGRDSLTVVLRSKENTPGRRATAATTESLEPAGDVATKADYKKELAKTLDQTAGILRHNPNGMRMKVQFGTLVINEWKKDKAEYTFAEIESLLSRAGSRGTAQMLST